MITQQAELAAQSAAEGSVALWGNISLGDPWFLALLPLFLVFTLLRSRGRRDVAGRVPVLPEGTL